MRVLRIYNQVWLEQLQQRICPYFSTRKPNQRRGRNISDLHRCSSLLISYWRTTCVVGCSDRYSTHQVLGRSNLLHYCGSTILCGNILDISVCKWGLASNLYKIFV